MVASEVLSYVQSNLLTRIIFFAVCLLLVILVLLYHYQNSMLYIPVLQGLTKESKNNPRGHRDPSDR